MTSDNEKNGSNFKRISIAVLMATYNRKETVVNCIESLYLSKPENWNLQIYLVDDASTDGTVQAVQKKDPNIRITHGDGNWYWAQSMYQAELSIQEPYDAILWLNDDVEVCLDSLRRVEKYFVSNPQSILVGQLRSKETESLTYGGYLKYDYHPFHFRPEYAIHELKEVDTFNGNFIFIPKSVSDIVGKIDGVFSHGYADIDYGLRARRLKIPMLLIPGFIGICNNNPDLVFKTIIQEIKWLLGRKGTPIRSQVRFLKRHGGIFWWVYIATPFLKVFFRRFLATIKIPRKRSALA
jgi:GT2 family glycosyltransferase